MKLYNTCCAGCCAALLLMTGCLDLDQTPAGEQEKSWQDMLKKDYPGWKPPRSVPPSVQGNLAPGVEARTAATVQETPLAPAVTDETAVPEAAADSASAVSPVPAAEDTDSVVGLPGDAVAAPAADKETPQAADPTEVKSENASPAKDEAKADGEAAAGEKSQETAFTEYTVVKGDSLSKIAQKVYHDGRLYYRIFKANQELLKNNADKLKPGMKLQIPQAQ